MTEKKLAANRKNALRSTGPKTPEGKKRASMNALRHGLRAASLAVPTMENPEDWTAHHDQVVRNLAPVGYLETILSERVAALLWRMGRVVRYESLSITTELENVVEDYMDGHKFNHPVHPEDVEAMREVTQENLDLFEKLPTMKAGAKVEAVTAWSFVEAYAEAADVELEEDDPEDAERTLFTIDLSELPDEDAPDEWEGWTAGLLRTVLDRVVKKAEADPEDIWETVRVSLYGKAYDAKRKADAVLKELERTRRERLIPDEKTLDKVSRYESHLERALFRTLHELERLKAARTGTALPPPAVLDVNLHQEAS